MSNTDRIINPPRPFRHSAPIQIRFADFDAFRHINNNAYMAYLDLGKALFLESLLGHPASPADLGAVIVNINVDFLAPTTIGETLSVLTTPMHLGDRSFSLLQRIVNPTTDSIKVQALTTLAGFDFHTQSGAPLPSTLLNSLKV